MDFTWWLGSYPIPNIFQGNHIVSCQSSYERDPNGAGVICKKEFSAWKTLNTHPKICKVTKLFIADRRPATTLNTLPGSFLCFCIIFLFCVIWLFVFTGPDLGFFCLQVKSDI